VGKVASSNLVVPTIYFQLLTVVSPLNGSMDSNLSMNQHRISSAKVNENRPTARNIKISAPERLDK
jgi:hypothetical protein